MTLFRESDKQVLEVSATDPKALEYIEPDEMDDGETITLVQYRCTVGVAVDRLELMGYTLQTAIDSFEAAKAVELQRYTEYDRERGSDLFGSITEPLRELTASSWMEGLREIVLRGLTPTYFSDEACKDYSPVLRYMLCQRGIEWYGYPGYDLRHMIRLAAEIFEGEVELVYDITDLVLGGYYDTAEDLTEHATYLLQEDFAVSQRVVVLTEGAVDKWVLERALALLYPHLVDYFTFMDFEGVRLAGGAGALANLVKAFVGAGILNRIVALFDNDTAALSALRPLGGISLPSNIVVMQYPFLGLAASYPTLGPSGIVTMDVNGLAGSIELYFGRDVLCLDRDTLTPVQWRGYDDAVSQYQGEVLHKRRLQEQFAHKLKICEADPTRISDFDWDGMHAILTSLRSAFHTTDAKSLIAEAGHS